MIGFLPHKTALPVTVDGHELEEYKAQMQSWPEITACKIDTGIFQGADRNTMHPLQNRRGVRYLTCLIDFMAPDWAAHISAFDALLARGAVEIDLGDGYLYRSILVSESAPSVAGETIATVEYRFQAVRHWPEQTITINTSTDSDTTVICQSNYAKTDCRIVLQYSGSLAAAASQGLNVWVNNNRWTYPQKPNGDIWLDGIRKTYTDNGEAISAVLYWKDFPYLVPGENTISVWNEIATGEIKRIRTEVELTYVPTFL